MSEKTFSYTPVDERGPVTVEFNGDYILRLSVTEFRKVKKAVAVLVRAGMQYHDALAIIVHAHNEARRYR